MIKFINSFYFGNIFLGLCAVALCIETNLVNHLALNAFPFYLLIFCCTIIYYTSIYVRSVRTKKFNERTLWYSHNLATIKMWLKAGIVLSVTLIILLIAINFHRLHVLHLTQVLLITVFPIGAAWYTFTPKVFKLSKIRQIGWIKPFMVGITWAGWVTIYPVIVWQLQSNQGLDIPFTSVLLLGLQNFLFFSINAIMFDIKDCRTDTFYKLKTYPVIFGIKNTFCFVILPLTAINLLVFFIFQWHQQFSFVQGFIQIIPYASLIFVLANYRQGRSVLYYLAAVDGLIFLKAICGITSILLIKK